MDKEVIILKNVQIRNRFILCYWSYTHFAFTLNLLLIQKISFEYDKNYRPVQF